MLSRIKYLAEKLSTWNYKDAIEQAKIIKKQRGGSVPLLVLDMMYCGAKYGAGYSDYVEFEFDLMNAAQRATYLTSELNNRIVRKYNDKKYWHLFQDKFVFNNLFKDFVRRDYMSIKDGEGTLDDFIAFCKKNPKICVKPIDQTSGEGIEIVRTDENTDFAALYDKLRNNKQYLIEECVKQHPELNRLYPGSVNTLRVITFLKDDGEAVVIRTVLKMGKDGEVDNNCAGGLTTYPDDNGLCINPATNELREHFDVHPVTGTKIVGFQIPLYEEALELSRQAAKVVPQIRYVGWDVAIAEDGPLIIEGNEYCGLFQNKASIDPLGDLPRFRKYIEF